MQEKKFQKPMTIDEQIINLKKINLVIDDEDYAKQFLNQVSYYRLIKAYSIGLKSTNGKYLDNINFDHIVRLYKFNGKLRQLLFHLFERIEINFRCSISNYFSLKYGLTAYKCPEYFANTNYHSDFLNDINTEISRNSRSPFVRNYTQNYPNGDIPFYALIELFSFGTLSKFYKNLFNTDKKEIAKEYNVGYTYLESWLESISYVRNICAHYGRVYNAILTKRPVLYNQYVEQGINNARIFSIIICLHHILPNDGMWKDFVKNLQNLISYYQDILNMDAIGFPANWLDILK